MSQNERRRNVVSNARSQQGRRLFYGVLGAIAVVGALVIGYVVANPKHTDSAPVTVAPLPANAGSPQGYLIGNPNAPVQILEFADFECPSCARFATITGPDIKKRIVDAGLASLTFMDFPLPQHRNSQAAHNAAACANEQGRFWEMHDRIFNGQDQWNTTATDNPGSVLRGYARELGLDEDKWKSCFDSRKYQKVIDANAAEGAKRNVNSTPSFIIGDKLFSGSLSYDEFKGYVDAAVAASGAVPPPAR